MESHIWSSSRHHVLPRSSIHISAMESEGELYTTHLHHTTEYYPQANGLAEHLHHHVKVALITHLGDSNLMDHLQWVLLGIWTAPRRMSEPD